MAVVLHDRRASSILPITRDAMFTCVNLNEESRIKIVREGMVIIPQKLEVIANDL